jgi:hypothetical protein
VIFDVGKTLRAGDDEQVTCGVEDFRDRPVTRLRQYLKFKNARPLCQGKAFCALAIKLPELPDQLSPCIPERATSLHFRICEA